MIWVLAGVTAVLAVLVAACFSAMVEVFRNIAEIRVVLDLQDEPTPLRISPAYKTVIDLGLPAALAQQPKAIVVFLSGKCGTCLTIADAFQGGAPGSVWFVLSGPSSPGVIEQKLTSVRDRVILDEEDAIATQAGLSVTPSVLTVSYGEISRAQAVSSARQVMGMIPTIISTEMFDPADVSSALALKGGAHA